MEKSILQLNLNKEKLMLGWLYRFFIGNFHSHKWKIISQNPVANEYGEKIGWKYHLQCENCGNIKRKRV